MIEAASRYDPAEMEPKWQRRWAEGRTFRAQRHAGKEKAYILDMFPYPSGAGLHAAGWILNLVVGEGPSR